MMNKIFSICLLLLIVGVTGNAFAQFVVVTYDQVVVSQEGLFAKVDEDLAKKT